MGVRLIVRGEALREDFRAEANARLERYLKGGPSFSWNAMQGYLRKRAQGIEVQKPKARTPSR